MFLEVLVLENIVCFRRNDSNSDLNFFIFSLFSIISMLKSPSVITFSYLYTSLICNFSLGGILQKLIFISRHNMSKILGSFRLLMVVLVVVLMVCSISVSCCILLSASKFDILSIDDISRILL